LPDTDSVVELVDLHYFVEAAGWADSPCFAEAVGLVGLAMAVEHLHPELAEQNWSLQPLQKMCEGVLN
jgi:hypothetical protein